MIETEYLSQITEWQKLKNCGKGGVLLVGQQSTEFCDCLPSHYWKLLFGSPIGNANLPFLLLFNYFFNSVLCILFPSEL